MDGIRGIKSVLIENRVMVFLILVVVATTLGLGHEFVRNMWSLPSVARDLAFADEGRYTARVWNDAASNRFEIGSVEYETSTGNVNAVCSGSCTGGAHPTPLAYATMAWQVDLEGSVPGHRDVQEHLRVGSTLGVYGVRDPRPSTAPAGSGASFHIEGVGLAGPAAGLLFNVGGGGGGIYSGEVWIAHRTLRLPGTPSELLAGVSAMSSPSPAKDVAWRFHSSGAPPARGTLAGPYHTVESLVRALNRSGAGVHVRVEVDSGGLLSVSAVDGDAKAGSFECRALGIDASSKLPIEGLAAPPVAMHAGVSLREDGDASLRWRRGSRVRLTGTVRGGADIVRARSVAVLPLSDSSPRWEVRDARPVVAVKTCMCGSRSEVVHVHSSNHDLPGLVRGERFSVA